MKLQNIMIWHTRPQKPYGQDFEKIAITYDCLKQA